MFVSSLLKNKLSKIITIAPESTIPQVVRLLSRHAIGAAVVVSGTGKVCGMVSERDIVRGLSAFGTEVMNKTVADLMTHKVHSCRSTDTLTELVKRLRAHEIRHLPVIDDGRLTGMVSLRDVVKERLSEVEADAEGIREYVDGDYAIPFTPERSVSHA